MQAASTLTLAPRLAPAVPTRSRADVGLYAVMAAIAAGLVGSLITGAALGAGWIFMPWSRAFATGLLGGAALGFLIGAAIAWVRGLLLPPPPVPVSTVVRAAVRVRRPTPAARG